MAKPRVVFVVGTRPDAIKSAPVVLEFLKYEDLVDTTLVATGQHREMLDQALSAFGLRANLDLAVMQHGQSLAHLTSRILTGLDSIFEELKPDMVFAQGDTTTTFIASLAAFYRQIKFGHIEAGLRTDSIWNPFPEEFNRRASALVASLHFPPTEWSAQNLFKENVEQGQIFVTGNTGIDAVMQIAKTSTAEFFPEHQGRVLLLTTHRRENWGERQREIALAVRDITDKFSDVLTVVPMHRNPNVRQTLTDVLANHPRIKLIEPPDYADFVKLMTRSTLILTDSGGVQEEAPTFGIPVLVLRETTERPEGVSAGTAKLIGTDKDMIVSETYTLLSDKLEYEKMSKAVSPYGDGKASTRIRFASLRYLGVATTEEDMWTSFKQ